MLSSASSTSRDRAASEAASAWRWASRRVALSSSMPARRPTSTARVWSSSVHAWRRVRPSARVPTVWLDARRGTVNRLRSSSDPNARGRSGAPSRKGSAWAPSMSGISSGDPEANTAPGPHG